MNDLATYQSTWSTFLAALIICALIILIYQRGVNRLISSLFYHSNEHKKSKYHYFFDRILILVLLSICAISFIAIRPTLHAFWVLTIIALAYKVLSNFVIGAALILEVGFEEGSSLRVGEHYGVIRQIKLTGLELSREGKLQFLPYSVIQTLGCGLKQSDNPVAINLICTVPGDASVDIIKKLKGELFGFPFVLNGTVPSVQRNGDNVAISVVVSSSAYKRSLLNLIGKTGLKIVKTED